MAERSLTTIGLKQINQNKIYQEIYERKTVSKMQLVRSLEMGLSTVSQNLKELEGEGLISREGFFDSTGGRKAHSIQIISTARIAIGLGLLKDMVHFVAIDLYGRTICKSTVATPYTAQQNYYCSIGNYLNQFIQENNLDTDHILGVSIATQGTISKDGSAVEYGTIMGNTQMALADFEAYIPYPCRLEHDSKAAAIGELWNHPDIDDGIVLLLNRNMGGALIANKTVQNGQHMRSGLIEHICLQPDGPLCYCGKRGCLETFCSAKSLEERTGMQAESFFDKLRNGNNSTLKEIWSDYLDHLAYAIMNLSMVIDGSFIISGYLAPFFSKDDINTLFDRINQMTPFVLEPTQLIFGERGQYTPAIGGALYYVKRFLNFSGRP